MDKQQETVNYTLRDIPVTTWRKLRKLAVDRDQSTKQVLLDLIEKAVQKTAAA